MTNYLYVPLTEYGKVRREYIKNWFLKNPDGAYAVNCKYRPQLKDDPDLRKLIKLGFLKKIRIRTHRSRARTYLVKA